MGDRSAAREYEVRRRRRRQNADADPENAGAQSGPAHDTRSEVESLQQSVGNQSVGRMLQSGAVQRAPLRADRAIRAQVQRQAKPKTAAQTKEAKAVAELTQHWGVSRAGAGAQAEQEQMMSRLSTSYFQSPTPPSNVGSMISAAGWTAWKPPADSSLWDDLVKAFESMAKVFGGVPPVKDVLFFKSDYEYDPGAAGGPALRTSNKELAHFSGGSFVIFEAATYQGTLMPLATGKSTAADPNPVGSRPAGFTLTHELGHGIVEAAMSQTTNTTVNDFAAAVGWLGGKLYDIGDAAVQTAFNQKPPKPPGPQYEIGEADWKDAKWKEQPISKYSLAGPSEDLPESIAAYIRDPQMLQARSPARFAFIAKLVSSLQNLGAASPLKGRTP